MSLAKALLVVATLVVISGGVARADDAPATSPPSGEPPMPSESTVPVLSSGASISCDRAAVQVLTAIRQHAYLDGHLIAQVARLGCDRFELDAWDAVALVHLDEYVRARVLLTPWRTTLHETHAGLLSAWTFWVERDNDAFTRALVQLPDSARLRLVALAAPSTTTIDLALKHDPSRRDTALTALASREHARERRPWLAGMLSVVVPGAGQLYAGSLESGAMAFVLNALAIGATIELARRELYVTAALTGTVASMFYAGNIGSAVSLARRRNELAQASWTDALRSALLPEAYP